MRETRGHIYLLHFECRVGGTGRNGALHYLGWAQKGGLEERIARHRSDRVDPALLRWLRIHGLDFHVVRVWEGTTRADERRMKKNGHYDRWCPLCRRGRK